MTKVAINGLGRIGRATLKILLEQEGFDVVAVNDIVPPESIAYLLTHDSVYGRFHLTVEFDESSLKVGGGSIAFFQEKDPAALPWRERGVEIVFECSGAFTSKEGMQKHLEAGAEHVILSAPEKDGDVVTVVHGVNEIDPSEQLRSCASCTTNCIAPVAEIMDRRIGVEKALMTTIHAYTSSQEIVDGPHKKPRRGRAGALNLVPTSTGAAKATSKALPHYEGIFDGVAVRAPVPVGSIVDITMVVKREVTVEEVNSIFREEAGGKRYQGILGVSEDGMVSSDIIQDERASVVDLAMTQVVGGTLVKVMSWYDNEWGYARQMVREAAAIARAAAPAGA